MEEDREGGREVGEKRSTIPHIVACTLTRTRWLNV